MFNITFVRNLTHDVFITWLPCQFDFFFFMWYPFSSSWRGVESDLIYTYASLPSSCVYICPITCPSFVFFFLPAVMRSAWKVQMAKDSDSPTLACLHTHTLDTQACTHFFMFFFFSNHHTVSPITDKKPPDNHFFDKVFMGAFLPYNPPPSLQNRWLTFLTVLLFSGSEKSAGPFPRLCVCRSFFFFFSLQICRPWLRSVDVLTSVLRLYFS